MINFLFWNLGKNKSISALVANMARVHEVDVIMLAECSITPTEMHNALRDAVGRAYHYSPGRGCRKIEVFARFPHRYIRPIFEANRLTIRHLKLPGRMDILVAVNHFPSKVHWEERDQTMEATRLASAIRRAESMAEHSRTILVGDLNMNPFESGMVGASGLHAMMVRSVAAKGQRVVQETEYPFFYNPMWAFFGDGTPGPPGTYYYADSKHVVHFWNMFDQVLIRPELLPAFRNERLRILDSDGEVSLLSDNGLPSKRVASDHLPILFALEI
ncbi:endonuclease/exonuclease/phosphatase family protein [Thermodesulfobacteriota bacterium]